MFSFLQKSKQPADELTATPPTREMLAFDAAGLVRAITYHLLDEHKVSAISAESSQAAVAKLSQRIGHITIAAHEWATMENVERLQWLLNQSHIVVRPTSYGIALLSVRR
jgi:hypothetical protein